MALNTLLKLLALSNDEIIKFKNEKSKNDITKREMNLYFIIKSKT